MFSTTWIPNVGETVGSALIYNNSTKMESRIARLVKRGWAGIWPSYLECPTKAALQKLFDESLIAGIKSGRLTISTAAMRALELDPKDANTLMLFETGNWWEEVVGNAIVDEHGAPPAFNSGRNGPGRNVRVEIEGVLAGEIDTITIAPDTGNPKQVILWEHKSTTSWAVKNRAPYASHGLQLWSYVWAFPQIYPDHEIVGAFLTYAINDKHAQKGQVLDHMRTYSLDYALRKVAGDSPAARLERARTYANEYSLDNPPPPYCAADDWPCSKWDKKIGGRVPTCPFYGYCYTEEDLDPANPWDEIPF